MKWIVAVVLITLVTACNDDSKESVNGIYTNGKMGVLIDTTHPDREAFFIEYNAGNQQGDAYKSVSEDIDNIVIAGECYPSSCDFNQELIGNLSAGELLLTDNSTGLTKSYRKQPSSDEIMAISGVTLQDDLSGTLDVFTDNTFSATTPLCSTITGTLQRYNYYYQLDATASGCSRSSNNGRYSGIGFSAYIENQLTVFVYLFNDSGALYGSFHD